MNDIEIRLTGAAAQNYIDGPDDSKHLKELEALTKEYEELKEGTKLLGEKYVKIRMMYDNLVSQVHPNTDEPLQAVKEVDEVSKRVQHDTELMEGIKESPQASKSPFGKPIKFEPTPKPKTGKWLTSELRIIEWRIDPDSNASPSERTMSNLVAKLPGRSESAIRSKLSKYGYGVKKNKLYKYES